MDDRWGKEIESDEITLTNLIGEGMYGKVYKGQCRSTSVAVKIPTRQQLSLQEIETFKREIDIMRNINHPNVCLFMGAVADDNGLKIVTELMTGDVEGLIFKSGSPISLLQRLRWAKDAAQGMAWLHANNPCILHRDMKPSNLLIDSSGKVKVTDFGLSQMIQQGAKVREVRPKGSPIYMAPEVMSRNNITTKVDVYSFAVTLWEIAKKEAAFSNHSDYAHFARAVLDGERPPLKDLPAPLANLIADCWDKDPQARPDFNTICNRIDDCILEIGIEGDSKIVGPARQFWKKNFDSEIQVEWTTFFPKLLKHLNFSVPKLDQNPELPVDASDELISDASQLQKREFARRSIANFRHMILMYGDDFYEEEDLFIIGLRLLFLKGQQEEIVHLDWFGKAVGWLGPFSHDMLLKYNELTNSEWFHGNLNKTEAEDRLLSASTGTFLVRFSTSQANQFVISRVAKDRSKKHMLVLHKAGEGYLFNKKLYKTLNQLLAENKSTFSLETPCLGSIFQTLKTPDNPYDQ